MMTEKHQHSSKNILVRKWQALTFLLMIAFLFASPGIVSAKKLYRWKDDNGQTHYGDRIPPKYAKKERRELNETGRTVKVKARAKTDEEKAEAAEKRKLQKIIDARQLEQDKADQILLQTFHSEADIDSMHNGKIETLNSRIKATSAKLDQFRNHVEDLNKQAANEETAGRAVSEQHVGKIKEAKKQINFMKSMIDKYKKEKESIKQKAAKIKKRFRELKIEGKKSELKTKNKKSALESKEKQT